VLAEEFSYCDVIFVPVTSRVLDRLKHVDVRTFGRYPKPWLLAD